MVALLEVRNVPPIRARQAAFESPGIGYGDTLPGAALTKAYLDPALPALHDHEERGFNVDVHP